jgi:DinB family protein
MSKRTEALAARLEQGAGVLEDFADKLSEAEWRTVCVGESRSVGVLVHHVAAAYLSLNGLMRLLASGHPVVGLTWDMVDQNSAQHAAENAEVNKPETLALLRQNSAFAANSIRELSDDQLDSTAPFSLNWDTPFSTQYFIEEFPIAHPYRHLASIRAALPVSAR